MERIVEVLRPAADRSKSTLWPFFYNGQANEQSTVAFKGMHRLYQMYSPETCQSPTKT